MRTGKASFSSSMWVMTRMRPKVILDRVDGLYQALAALGVLGAKPLVDDQHLELGPGPAGQQLAQGDADGKVDAERLAAGEQLVGPRAQLVGDVDVQRLDGVALEGLPLGLKADVHPAIGHARQQAVGLELDLGDGRLDDHGLDALLAKGQAQFVIDGLFLGQRCWSADLVPLPLLGQVAAMVQFLLGCAQGQPRPGRLGLQFLHLAAWSLTWACTSGRRLHLAARAARCAGRRPGSPASAPAAPADPRARRAPLHALQGGLKLLVRRLELGQGGRLGRACSWATCGRSPAPPARRPGAPARPVRSGA